MKVTMTEAICHEGMALLEGKADIFVAHDACPHNYLDQMKDTDAFIVRIADKGAVDRNWAFPWSSRRARIIVASPNMSLP